MSELPSHRDSSGDVGLGSDRASSTSTPRWVKVFATIAIVLVLFVLFVVLTGVGGPHGPGRHMPSGGAGRDPGWGELILLGFLVVAAVSLNWNWLVASIGIPPRRRIHIAGRWPSWLATARGWSSMAMTPGLRKLALTAHVSSSVGSLGAVAGFLALAVAGPTSQEDAQTVRDAYLAMELTARFVIVPLILASLLTGLVSSLGTPWGLFRHYWVLVKLLLNVFVTIVLLLQMEAISYMAGAAAETTMSSADLNGLKRSLVMHATGGLLVLLVATVLGVYKPRGMTRYGERKEREGRAPSQP